MNNGRDILRYWADNVDSRLYPAVEPKKPEWCSEATQLRETGNALIGLVQAEPTSEKLGLVKGLLLDSYAHLWFTTTNDHRPETYGGNHHCIHDALLLVWKQLDNLDMAQRMLSLEDLLKPAPAPLPVHPVIDMDVDIEPSVQEYSGIVVGHQKDEPQETDEDE